MPVTQLHDVELLYNIRARSRVGAEALYDRYAKILGLAIFRIVKRKDLTDQLLEAVICKVWNTADQYNEQELPLLTWMLTIARGMAKGFEETGNPVVK